MAERLALDTSSQRYRPENLIDGNFEAEKTRLAADLAALVLETSSGITHYTFVETENGQVVCPQYPGVDVAEILAWDTPADTLESLATLKIRDFILSNDSENDIVAWILPPNETLGYPEGRMVIGFSHQSKNGLTVVEKYGLVTRNSLEESLSLGNQLFSISNSPNLSTINSAEVLRGHPFFIRPPEGIDPLEFLSQHLPLPNDTWENIKSGRAKALGERVYKFAQEATEEHFDSLQQTQSQAGFINIGALMEEEMMRLAGWKPRVGSGCGTLNSEVSASWGTSFIHFQHRLNLQGETTYKTESSTFVKKCPYCEKTINQVIEPGYRCSCGQVFTGSCGRHQ